MRSVPGEAVGRRQCLRIEASTRVQEERVGVGDIFAEAWLRRACSRLDPLPKPKMGSLLIVVSGWPMSSPEGRAVRPIVVGLSYASGPGFAM